MTSLLPPPPLDMLTPEDFVAVRHLTLRTASDGKRVADITVELDSRHTYAQAEGVLLPGTIYGQVRRLYAQEDTQPPPQWTPPPCDHRQERNILKNRTDGRTIGIFGRRQQQWKVTTHEMQCIGCGASRWMVMVDGGAYHGKVHLLPTESSAFDLHSRQVELCKL